MFLFFIGEFACFTEADIGKDMFNTGGFDEL